MRPRRIDAPSEPSPTANARSSCPAPARPRSTFPTTSSCDGGLDAYGAAAGPRLHWRARPSRSVCAATLTLDTGLARELLAFTQRTGIRLELAPLSAEDALSFDPTEPDRRPDVLIFHTSRSRHGPQTARSTSAGSSTPRPCDPTSATILLSFGTSDTVGEHACRRHRQFGPFRSKVQPKGLVFYPKAEFQKAGYEIPTTWDELIALSDRIVADGGTPWCFGFESGGGSGWPGTDLIESLVLRVGGVEHLRRMDAWRDRFHQPSGDGGRPARRRLGVHARLREGRAGEHQREHLERPTRPHAPSRQRDGRDRTAVLAVHGADFMLNFVPPTDQIGTDIDFFVLPPVDPRSADSGHRYGAAFVSALVDRPEVRAFMEFVASPEWGTQWASDADGAFVSPNQRFDLSNYGDVERRSRCWRSYRGSAEAANSALQSDAFRMDASDLMPSGNRGADHGRCSGCLLARDGRLGRRNPHHRAGLRRHRRQVGSAQSVPTSAARAEGRRKREI